MLRRGICIVAFVGLPAALLSAQGCSDAPDLEDLCTWLSSPTNCAVRFADDVETRCGAAYVEGSTLPADATGYFLSREELEICVRTAGGQVIFDPPLDMAAFPPTAVSFKMLDALAAPCGEGFYGGTHNFSITIQPLDLNDAGTLPPDSGLPGDHVVGGTFASTTTDGNAFDVTCPGGQESHHFSTLLVQKCPDLDPYLPRAYLESSPGIPPTDTSVGADGYVRLRVVYPPPDPGIPGSAPREVEYFSCTIPAPPHHCQDGIRNAGETDIDCGGTCANRCADGMSCFEASDCLSGICDYEQGIQMCLPAG